MEGQSQETTKVMCHGDHIKFIHKQTLHSKRRQILKNIPISFNVCF